MIAYLKGNLLEIGPGRVVVEAGGIGYEVCVPASCSSRWAPGQTLELHVEESVGMYGGGTTLYGFPTREEKELFVCLKENVPNTGAKKALEYLDRAAKSLPDFRRAILERDPRMLLGIFGFTKKTAERLIVALKDRMGLHPFEGPESPARRNPPAGPEVPAFGQAVQALFSLGYRASEARTAVAGAAEEAGTRAAGVEELIRLSLKRLSRPIVESSPHN